jgi:hypothetical protein
VWVLVALLHWTAAPAADLAGITEVGTAAAQVLVDLPTGAASAFLLAITLFLLFLLGARRAPAGPRSMRVRWFAAAGAHTRILGLHLASRAPPVIA